MGCEERGGECFICQSVNLISKAQGNGCCAARLRRGQPMLDGYVAEETGRRRGMLVSKAGSARSLPLSSRVLT